MNRAAATASIALSILFLVVYGGCNWIAAQRASAGTWYFAWERGIPFVPMSIVPYLSIDAFFVAAPFLCRTREELALFARRVSAAIVVAGTCFLVMPLRFAFERPAVEGWAGSLFHAFSSLDRPFNLFPSLHIALAMILLDTWARHTRGAIRVAVRAWFALIAVSTVLTYQHHVVDVAGGLLLAACVFYWIEEAPIRQPVTPNMRVAGYYALGAVAACVVAFAAWPWSGVWLWPAASLAIVAGGYLGLGPGIFRKKNGAIALAARILLWPCLAGQWISLAYYRRHCRPYDEIAPGLLIGRRLSEREAKALTRRGITAVLDLTAELSEPRAFVNVAYRNIQILDLTAPTLTQLRDAAAFIAHHAAGSVSEKREHAPRGEVYVHCKIGYSRSAAAVGAYLLASGRVRTADEAVAMLRRARPSIVVRPEAYASLRRFETLVATGRPDRLRLDRAVRRSVAKAEGRHDDRSTTSALMSAMLAGLARLFCGAPRWIGCEPSARQRIYYANHTSHLDFLVLWASLPPEVRAVTRPVAGRDYWDRGRVRRYLARRVFRAVLIDRRVSSVNSGRAELLASARQAVQRAADALAAGASLIIFPEGTRGTGPDVATFKSGLYHLCRLRPDVELVPVYLENLNRILPKGEAFPLPLAGGVTFGRPLHLEPGEDKDAFLDRARVALVNVNQPSCLCSSTLMSRAS